VTHECDIETDRQTARHTLHGYNATLHYVAQREREVYMSYMFARANAI